MTPNNTVIQIALKPVHQKLPLDTGNLGRQNRALLAVLPQSKCSPDSTFFPQPAYGDATAWRCRFALHNSSLVVNF
jgi:hypothetical protein